MKGSGGGAQAVIDFAALGSIPCAFYLPMEDAVKRSIRATLTSVALVLVGMISMAGIVTAQPVPAGSSAPSSGVSQTSARPVTGPTNDLAIAMQYVHVSNYVATVDPAIKQALPASYVARVYATTAKYNALPLTVRNGTAQATTLGARANAPIPNVVSGGGGGGCSEYARYVMNWWGVSLYMNDCLIQDVVFGAAVGSVLAGVVSYFCPPCAPAAIIIAADIDIHAAWLNWADGHCGNRGAWLQDPYIAGGAAWVTTVC